MAFCEAGILSISNIWQEIVYSAVIQVKNGLRFDDDDDDDDADMGKGQAWWCRAIQGARICSRETGRRGSRKFIKH